MPAISDNSTIFIINDDRLSLSLQRFVWVIIRSPSRTSIRPFPCKHIAQLQLFGVSLACLGSGCIEIDIVIYLKSVLLLWPQVGSWSVWSTDVRSFPNSRFCLYFVQVLTTGSDMRRDEGLFATMFLVSSISVWLLTAVVVILSYPEWYENVKYYLQN